MSDDLTNAIEEKATKLGIPLKMAPDEDLDDYEQGSPLTLGEIRQMPDDAIVWAWGKEYGEEGARINGPYRINKVDGLEGEETWGLNDGSSFGAEFTHTGEDASGALCYDDWCGNGEMLLFHAEKIEALTWVPTSAEIRREIKPECGDIPKSWRWTTTVQGVRVFMNQQEVSTWLPTEKCWMSVRPKGGQSVDDAARLLVKRR